MKASSGLRRLGRVWKGTRIPDDREAAASFFDRAFYLRDDPGLRESGLDPVEHYLRQGAQEGRAPHPLFDPRWYLATNPDVVAHEANPLVHYVRHGRTEGRAPNALFDPAWYLAQNPDAAATGIDPVAHYLTSGGSARRRPHPLFDPHWYLTVNPDVAAAGIDPLAHYLANGFREGRSPHVLFDVPWYLATNPDVAASHWEPVGHYLLWGTAEGRNPHPLFDTSWYLAANPDVVAGSTNPLIHYADSGRRENRLPNPFFDPVWYLDQNPGVAAAGHDPFTHYLEFGGREGRKPHPLFDAPWYRRVYRDAIALNANPLVDFLTNGRREGRAPNAVEAKQHSPARPITLPSDSILVPATSRSRKPLVLLVTHDCSLTGGPMVVLELAEYLVAEGAIDVVALSIHGGVLAERFQALPDFQILGQDGMKNLDDVLEPFSARPLKVAFCNTVVTSGLVGPLRRHGFRVVSLVHEMPAVVEQFGASRIRDIDEAADAIVFGSSFVRDAIVRAYEPSNAVLFVVPTGTASPVFTADDVAAARRRLREEAGFPQDAFVVLGCGTVDYRKGVDLFLSVAQHVMQNTAPGPDIRFVWIGTPTQPYMRFCLDDVEKLGLSSRVRLLEARPDLARFLPGADVFTLTSREDPFPLVTLSAMACAVPPIVFDRSGGAPDAVAGDAGMIVPYLDLSAMAAAILALAADPGRRITMGRRAFERYREHYTERAFAKGLSTVLAHIGTKLDLTGRARSSAPARPGKEVGRPSNQVSVVIPSYNHARYVETAIRSVLDQDEPIRELIIVDDGSRDGSDRVIRRVIDDYEGPVTIRYEPLKTNGGAHAAIMRGLSIARGEILSILNSDDSYATNRFSTMLRQVPAQGDFIAFSAVDFLDEACDRLDEDSGIAGWYRMALGHVLECPTVGFALLRNNIAVTSGNLVFTRELYRKVGGFARYRMCHDWDFLMRASHYVEPIFVQEVRMAYRVHPTNTLNSTRHLLREEGTAALNAFVELTRHEPSPNPLAPSRRNWPIFFDYFTDTVPPWFAAEPIRIFIRHSPSPAPLATDAWRFGGRNDAAEMGILTAACREQDALALRRAVALAARPVDPSKVGFPTASRAASPPHQDPSA